MAWTSLQVTIPTGGGPVQFSTSQILCRALIIQNNAAAAMRVGDSQISATRGIALPASSNPLVIGPVHIYNQYLSDWWAFGTATQVLDVLYNT